MSAGEQKLSHHPAPQSDQVSLWESFFGLFGAPAAWFLQVCAIYGLANEPCFFSLQRAAHPLAKYSWTTPTMMAISIAATLIGAAASLSAWRAYRRTAEEQPGGHEALLEIGTGRTRFLALWGMVFGVGFTLTIIADAVGQTVLPRCGG